MGNDHLGNFAAIEPIQAILRMRTGEGLRRRQRRVGALDGTAHHFVRNGHGQRRRAAGEPAPGTVACKRIALSAVDHIVPLVRLAGLAGAGEANVDLGVGQAFPASQGMLHQQRRGADVAAADVQFNGNKLGGCPRPTERAGLENDVELFGQDPLQEAAGRTRLFNAFGRQRRIEPALLAAGLVRDRLAMTNEVDQDVASRRPMSVSLQTSQSGFSGLLNHGSAQPRSRQRRTMAAPTA